MSDFEAAEHLWVDRLGNLRNVIRQEVIARQIAPLIGPGSTVLDVGCGQGTQALRLASAGCRVTGVDPSRELLRLCADRASVERLSINLVEGGIDDLEEALGDLKFDLVCCHGLMMYYGPRAPALKNLANRISYGGRLSITYRNAHALAMRPGMRRDWTTAMAAFDSREYINELGLRASADRLEDIEVDLGGACLELVDWWGVRVFNDAISPDIDPPGDEELAVLLDAEEQAGARDPYRWMASQLHVIARSASE